MIPKSDPMHRTLTTLLIAAATLVSAPAQTAADGKAPSARVRFAYLATDPSTPGKLLVLTKNGPAEISISARTPGEYFDLDLTNGVILGTKGDTPEKPILPIASGTPPVGAKKLTALLAPKSKDAAGKTHYEFLFLDEAVLQPGSVFYINKTDFPVGVIIDGTKFAIKPQENMLKSFRTEQKGRNTYCSFHRLEVNQDGSPTAKLITESTWSISPDRAEVCVFVFDPSIERVKCLGMSIFFPKSEETKESP